MLASFLRNSGLFSSNPGFRSPGPWLSGAESPFVGLFFSPQEEEKKRGVVFYNLLISYLFERTIEYNLSE